MTHGTMLHGSNYACEIEVWADGFRAVLLDPYHECKLLVRRTETGSLNILSHHISYLRSFINL
jgi:hypothetical protein